MMGLGPRRHVVIAGAGTAAWLVVVLSGLFALAAYKAAPSPGADVPATWPVTSRIAPATDRATLVMMVHPRCPCSRASISELEELVSQVGARVSVHVLFMRPHGVPAGWELTDLWKTASAIEGVQVWPDEDGREAALFGAKTSGQAVVYDANGALLFSGGITGIRGHPGDNAGRQRLVALLTARAADKRTSLVFGCALGDHPQNSGR